MLKRRAPVCLPARSTLVGEERHRTACLTDEAGSVAADPDLSGRTNERVKHPDPMMPVCTLGPDVLVVSHPRIVARYNADYQDDREVLEWLAEHELLSDRPIACHKGLTPPRPELTTPSATTGGRAALVSGRRANGSVSVPRRRSARGALRRARRSTMPVGR